MTIKFTKEETKYIYTDSKDDYRMKLKEDAPEKIKESVIPKIKAFNKWINEINGVEK